MKRVISILLCAWWAIASSSADDWSGNLTFSVADMAAFNGCMGTLRSAADPRPVGTATLAAARYFVGRPYAASTLEREPERLVVNLREWDCTTLVESAVALARTAIKQSSASVLSDRAQASAVPYAYTEPEPPLVAEPVVSYMTRPQLEKAIERARRRMTEAARKLEFIEAAQYRDEMLKLQELLDGKPKDDEPQPKEGRR